MEYALAFLLGFIVGSLLMKRHVDQYWIRRIRKNEIPSPNNVKYWNP